MKYEFIYPQSPNSFIWMVIDPKTSTVKAAGTTGTHKKAEEQIDKIKNPKTPK